MTHQKLPLWSAGWLSFKGVTVIDNSASFIPPKLNYLR